MPASAHALGNGTALLTDVRLCSKQPGRTLTVSPRYSHGVSSSVLQLLRGWAREVRGWQQSVTTHSLLIVRKRHQQCAAGQGPGSWHLLSPARVAQWWWGSFTPQSQARLSQAPVLYKDCKGTLTADSKWRKETMPGNISVVIVEWILCVRNIYHQF